MIKLVLRGKPISTNHSYKFTCRGRFPSMYMAADAKALKLDYTEQAKKQFKEKPLDGDLMVALKLHHKDKRKHDIDNYCKLVFDSLNGVLWEDDGQIIELVIQKYVDKDDPRVEVVIN